MSPEKLFSVGLDGDLDGKKFIATGAE